ncbi:MAG: 30S ribosomal protein S3ae [Candidatus Thermoplasmatota archaeon]|nr:30S ribosomal protein S3ae [Candidatus Thermoplasmatota archaeon]
MPEKKATKKPKDKWKLKSWYKVIAPAMFDNATLGETIADTPEKLKGRVLETTAQDLTGDVTKGYFKLYFQINEVRGSEASTRFIGHELSNDYVRRLTRRRKAKLDIVCDVLTSDNCKLRIKPLAIAERELQSSQELAIKNIMQKVIEENAKAKTFSELIKAIISGELTTKLFNSCKSIYPLRRIEIRKSEAEGVFAAEAPPKEEKAIES